MRIAKFAAVMWRPCGTRVQGFGFRAKGLGFRVLGFGLSKGHSSLVPLLDSLV